MGITLLQAGCEQKKEYQSQAKEIFPPHELFTVALFRMNNLNIASAYFKDHWSTVMLAQSPCESTCLKRLVKLDGVGEGQKLFVFDNLASTEHIKELTEKFKTVDITMGVTATSTDYFLAHFDIEGIERQDRDNYFYLVNPEGAIAYSLVIDGVSSVDIENEIKALAIEVK